MYTIAKGEVFSCSTSSKFGEAMVKDLLLLLTMKINDADLAISKILCMLNWHAQMTLHVQSHCTENLCIHTIRAKQERKELYSEPKITLTKQIHSNKEITIV